MIGPTDLTGVDDALARRVLTMARSIAPCLSTLEGEPKQDAIAILRGVIAEIPAPGSSRVRSKSRNGTSISYTDISSAFSADDRSALRSLCSSTSSPQDPIGSFPTTRAFKDVWPEEEYSS